MMRADRGDEDAAWLEPLQKAVGDGLHGRSDDDAIELAKLRSKAKTVGEHDLDVVIAERFEPPAGGVGEGAEALDGHDPTGQLRQDRRLVARTGANLEHAMALLQLQLLGHVS